MAKMTQKAREVLEALSAPGAFIFSSPRLGESDLTRCEVMSPKSSTGVKCSTRTIKRLAAEGHLELKFPFTTRISRFPHTDSPVGPYGRPIEISTEDYTTTFTAYTDAHFAATR